MGWSCTIRSGQMLIFNFLSCLNYTNNYKNATNDLLSNFVSDEMFSITNFLDVAQVYFSK